MIEARNLVRRRAETGLLKEPRGLRLEMGSSLASSSLPQALECNQGDNCDRRKYTARVCVVGQDGWMDMAGLGQKKVVEECHVMHSVQSGFPQL